MQPNRIHSTLTIFAPELSGSIIERIEQDGKFTTVTDNPPSDIAPLSLSLLCLDTPDNADVPSITHICLLKKQQRVATGQVRLKGTDVVALQSISTKNIVALLPKKLQASGEKAFSVGYKAVPPKTGEAILKALLTIVSDEKKQAILRLIEKIGGQKIKHRSKRADDAAAEKDALGICLDIFGIDRPEILATWTEAGSSNPATSFLSGLKEYVAYEDDLISKDIHLVPGWKEISEEISGIVEFENDDGDKLTVINANRKPLEHAFGVDLIYFHRGYNAFTFVQYKMMDKQGSKSDEYYFNPNQKSHAAEITRMNTLHTSINGLPKGASLSDYRLGECPIFFKLCKKLQLKGDDTSIAAGAYIPLDHWNMLLTDESTKGPKGGRQIGYKNLKKRYLGTKTFIDLVQLGFIGTQSLASHKIALFIEEAIKSGHSVLYAIDSRAKGAGSPIPPR